jgi:beta-ring hydroxylase
MYIPTPSWFSFRAAVKKLNDYCSGLVVARWDLRLQETIQSTGRKHDVLDKILSAISVTDWCPQAVRQVQDEIKTFILAGHETSASMLTWSLYELLVNPECMKRVKAEAEIVFGGNHAPGRVPSRKELEALLYTECCLRETLRKYSVVPSVVRVASEPIELGEYHIEKGATIMINIQGVHHDPQFWPEPSLYKPERFLSDIQPFTFLPFVEGPRMCLGQYLSILESKTVLAWLVHNYEFFLENKDEAGQKHPFMVPLIPKIGHYMKVK